MKIEIFYYSSGQRAQANRLATLVREHVYPTAAPSIYDVDTFEDDQQMAWRYIQLIQGSIHVGGDIEFLRSFPLRAQKMAGQGGFYAPRIATKAWTFESAEQKRFFPSVAIRDRMVLVPKGLPRLIASKFSVVPTANVAEVNFNNESALNDALKKIGETLRSEIRRDLQAHASYVSFNKDNLAEMAQTLRTDVGFLRYACESLRIERTVYERLKCEIDKKKVPAGRWSKLLLTIHNASKMHLSNMTVKLDGPVQVRPTPIQTSILPRSSRQIEISLMPDTAGEFPLELVFILPEDGAFADWLPVRHIWLKCE